MQFGVSINRDEPAGVSPADELAAALERAHAARDLGFGLLGFGHRYSTGPAVSTPDRPALTTRRLQPLHLIAHVAAELKDTVEYSTNILLSASAHPVSLAEEVATLDTLCHGRFRLGLGVGWLDYEFEAFGVPRAGRVRRFTELVELYRLLLTEDDVSYSGEFFRVRGVRTLARCVQEPMAPLWIGGSLDAAVRRAARLGDAWIMSSHIPMSDLERQVALFTTQRREAGLPPPTQFPIVRTVYVARTREEALRLAEPAMRRRYAERGDRGWFLTRGDDLAAGFGDGRWIIGSPEDAIEQILGYRERLGVTHMIFSYQAGGPGSDRASLLRMLELLGEQVIPYCRDAQARREPA
ncbi:LLM class flavin-dependent oxidoreductase [Actinophytocola sp.]|uniref:LLM class flavin-dependent oxidoreductase n=1 Tax=Actinophytocola sp. TaxID=1872138 RepID=UPI003D6B3EB7